MQAGECLRSTLHVISLQSTAHRACSVRSCQPREQSRHSQSRPSRKCSPSHSCPGTGWCHPRPHSQRNCGCVSPGLDFRARFLGRQPNILHRTLAAEDFQLRDLIHSGIRNPGLLFCTLHSFFRVRQRAHRYGRLHRPLLLLSALDPRPVFAVPRDGHVRLGRGRIFPDGHLRRQHPRAMHWPRAGGRMSGAQHADRRCEVARAVRGQLQWLRLLSRALLGRGSAGRGVT
mmetsp:Transcript_11528/g.27644  ORF Transcript_11528/g.27644 Transcript_11528/m.27644 type:complete len:230 (-) Transcript_11528:1827-2516(-)